MNLTLYGICFKMKNSLDLLDFVQSNTPVPIEIMQQAMDQMDSVTKEELAFAEKMRDNWKKAVNEKVPLIMNVAPDGGYEITCSIPNGLLDTVHLLTGLDNSKIAEEYTADYLKNVCGIDADIISVDVESHEGIDIKTEPVQGFSIEDLDADPEEPMFENVDWIETDEASDTKENAELFTDVRESMEQEPMEQEPMEQEPMEQDSVYEHEPGQGHIPDDPASEGIYTDDPDILYEEAVEALEETYSMEEELPYPEEAEEAPETEAEPEQDPEEAMHDTMAGIYKELVGNIREKRLDERLGLKIG